MQAVFDVPAGSSVLLAVGVEPLHNDAGMRWSSPGLKDTFQFMKESFFMPGTRNPYLVEFRNQSVALAQSGCSVESLAREIEPCVATIHGWIKQTERDEGVHR